MQSVNEAAEIHPKATTLREKLLENPDVDWDHDEDDQISFEDCI